VQPDGDPVPGDVPPGIEAGVVVAYGRILRAPLLDALPLVNLHPSALPRWRGAAPIERAIMAGDRASAVAVIRVVAALDAGPVLAREPMPIGPADDAGVLYRRAAELGVPLLTRVLREGPPGEPQPADGVTYAHKITAADRRIDWTRPADELERQVRALSPHIGARAELDGRPLVVWRAAPAAAGPSEPGAVAAADGRLLVGCGAGSLALLDVQPGGGRRMTAVELLRGLRERPRRAT
jgi:methionyl-tRNA formyltransferase